MPHRPNFNQSIFDDDARGEGTAAEREALLEGDAAQPARTPYILHSASTFAPGHVPHADLPVFRTVHRIRRDVIQNLDDPYSLEQLRAPRMNTTVVRPMVDALYELDDVSVVYCLLLNRVQFLRQQSYKSQNQTLNTTRALLCELVASRILRRFDEDNPGNAGLLLLANILVCGFDPFQNAPPDVLEENGRLGLRPTAGYRGRTTALELAIISRSKLLLSSASCQKVMEAIYEGRVIFTPTTFVDMIPDHYKHKRISLYHPRQAGIFNQYRLRVPRTRGIMDIISFSILLALYIGVMQHRDLAHFSAIEVGFCVYSLGWILEQVASILEHGWLVYTQNLWAFLDVTFAAIFGTYLCLRIWGLHSASDEPGRLPFDVLAVAAPVLVPRLAFNLLSENMLFISLRDMMANFAVLMVLAVWCFLGFFLALCWIGFEAHASPGNISKSMLMIWFGLDGTGISTSAGFQPVLGPVLMILFAFLGNTLFLTILVSMLTNTFSNIVANASAEIQFRRAVMTFEGVKSDAIFSFLPPFNILALLIFTPLKFVLSPRRFHQAIVYSVRFLNMPTLLGIALYERYYLWPSRRQSSWRERRQSRFWSLSNTLTIQEDTKTVFEAEPSGEVLGYTPRTAELYPASEILVDGQPAVHAPEAASPHPHRIVRTSNGSMRKESVVGPFSELADYLHDLVQDASGLMDHNPRMLALEGTVQKMETMLSHVIDHVVPGQAADERRLSQVSEQPEEEAEENVDRSDSMASQNAASAERRRRSHDASQVGAWPGSFQGNFERRKSSNIGPLEDRRHSQVGPLQEASDRPTEAVNMTDPQRRQSLPHGDQATMPTRTTIPSTERRHSTQIGPAPEGRRRSQPDITDETTVAAEGRRSTAGDLIDVERSPATSPNSQPPP